MDEDEFLTFLNAVLDENDTVLDLEDWQRDYDHSIVLLDMNDVIEDMVSSE